MVTTLPSPLQLPKPFENLCNSNRNHRGFISTQASLFPCSVSAPHRVRILRELHEFKQPESASNFTCDPFKISHFVEHGFEHLPISRFGSDQNRIFIDDSAQVDESEAKLTSISSQNHLFSEDGSIQNRISITDQASMNGEFQVSEVESTIKKLRDRAEKIRALEMESFVKKRKGEVTDEERRLVEKMSKEIVNGFLESAVGYLRRGGGEKCGDLGVKTGDLHAIERMFDLESGEKCGGVDEKN